ncbi:MAG TPA: hemerythrin domain-containing protein [Candidatus Edwardsbacteria bacterium]|nr:hemerythrin domain-containing protein [Candidatus Edwardsbacteria bacterium]
MEENNGASSGGRRGMTAGAPLLSAPGHQEDSEVRRLLAALSGEHRLIDVLLGVMRETLAGIGQTKRADPGLLHGITDFMRGFVEQCHHRKEEHILYRELFCRELSAGHRGLIDQALGEHAAMQSRVRELEHATACYEDGPAAALDRVAAGLQELLMLCPLHIAREETHVGELVRCYFTGNEKEGLLRRYQGADRDPAGGRHRILLNELRARCPASCP